MSANKIVVFGGSGFLGSRLVAALAELGYAVVVPTRRADAGRRLTVLPGVRLEQLGDYSEAALVELLSGASAVYFLVGILHEKRGGDFHRVHVDLLRAVLSAARRAKVPRFLHVSALRASPGGPSEYLRSKAAAEAQVKASGLAWTVFQPSVIFGPGDSFLSLFASLLRWSWVVLLAAPEARFQPVFVGDVVKCLVRALNDGRTIGQIYPLCGPRTYTLRELVSYVAAICGRSRVILGLGTSLSAIQAAVLELLPGPLLTRDNLRSMQLDNVCDCPFPAVFALRPTALEEVAPSYLGPAAAADPYAKARQKRSA